jgi:hypothetical protein
MVYQLQIDPLVQVELVEQVLIVGLEVQVVPQSLVVQTLSEVRIQG